MSKNIPLALLEHKQQPATTLCYLLKIGPLPNGDYIVLTSLDRDVEYDDGLSGTFGPLIYYARTGTELSSLDSKNDLTVDNGEAKSLVEVPAYPGQGVSVAMVDNGELDGAEFVVYQVNYKDLSMGHEFMTSGTIGEVRVLRGGLLTFELRSWSDMLKQNSVCEVDSLDCRARFGSQPGEQRHPCNYDLSLEWITDQVVTAVGVEVVKDFTASALGQATDYFAPGLVTWLTGANAGQSREVEAFASGGDISLQFIVRNAIQVGDTFNIRRDCTKKWSGHNSCETYSNRPNFRGEPYIPVSDVIGLSVPLAGA